MDLFKDLIKHIQDASYILIAGHVSPDGDAIGACTAMGLILEQMGKEYSILLEKSDERYSYLLDHVHVIQEIPERDCDLFIALDCGDLDRLGDFKSAHDNAPISWNIDHHISNTGYSKYNHVDTKASSASEIVFNIYKASEVKLNTQIAEAIYTGIVYDTAAFKHSNTTPKTFAVASELLKQPFDFSSIIQKMFYEQSLLSMQLQGAAIRNMESYYNNALMVSTLSLEEIHSYSDETNGTGGIVNVLKNIKDSKVALFLYEKSEGVIKVSMRSEDPYDICEIAKQFGGGGHKKAAGATLNSTLEEAKEQIIPLLMALFK
ncbi:MAG TPA: bifunctional oligoribonuclease/PAP phosphatase NrnA [Epulopiscium sp.]|nr:bifunctional oligoribonuclease/PAP phosphatase NrnA [Candidatus Epulonipiscium sp.]